MENISKKKKKLEEHKQKSLEGIKRKAELEKEDADIEKPELGIVNVEFYMSVQVVRLMEHPPLS